jgi:putative inorganic carbon (hco3(-)) transporter
MNSPWQWLTLANFSPQQWQESSRLHKLVGIWRSFRQTSYLMQWDYAIATALLAIVIGLSPFVPTALVGVLLSAVAIFWLILTLSGPQRFQITPIHIPVMVYWAIASVATAFSPVRAAALEGWRNTTLFVLLFSLAAVVFRNRRLANILLTILLLVALIVSTYGLYQSIHGAPPLATWNDPASPMAKHERVYSYLNNPNLLAGYLLPAIALSLAACFSWTRLIPRLLAILMTLVNSICLYFTDSRGGWIGFFLLFTTFVLLSYSAYNHLLPRFWRVSLIPLVFGALATLLVLAFIFVEPLRLRLSSIFLGRGDSSNNFRINVWLAVLNMIKDRPILGIGPGHGTFNKIYPLYMQARYSALGAYSIYLETALELGIIGLLSFLWLVLVTIGTALKEIIKTGNFWLIGSVAALAGMLGHGFVDTVWYRPEIHVIWWILIGYIAGQYPQKANLSASSPEPSLFDHRGV